MADRLPLQRTEKAQVVEVVHVVSIRGLGETMADPVREIHQYWSKDGRLLAEYDVSQDSERRIDGGYP